MVIDYIARGKEVFAHEIKELQAVAARLDHNLADVVDLIYHRSGGKVVITGIGKTGIIGHKIAASMASTGTPAIFLNAAEAMHGDLGMVAHGDVVIVISNSGESEEIVNLIAPLKKMDCPIVAMTGNVKSSEACRIGLAPTSSTTAALVMGDALTVCLMERRDFRPENFALYHPGGALGRRMLTRVRECMTHTVPTVYEDTLFRDVVSEVSTKKLGITMVKSRDNGYTGIITDGDIRRAVQTHDDLQSLRASDIMSHGFKRIGADEMVNDAMELMDLYKITTLAVMENDEIIGILHIHNIYGFRRR